MAVLNRDDFFTNLQARLGNDTSEEGIQFLEDMTDTYNDLENRANGDGENWEQKYHDLDKSWKERYKHRFFSGGNINIPDSVDEEIEEEQRAEQIKIDDLFN